MLSKIRKNDIDNNHDISYNVIRRIIRTCLYLEPLLAILFIVYIRFFFKNCWYIIYFRFFKKNSHLISLKISLQKP